MNSDIDTDHPPASALARAIHPDLAHEPVQAVERLTVTLIEGAHVADVRCDDGAMTIRLAAAFPRSRVHGFDPRRSAVERAVTSAHAAGVGDRVSFRRLDAAAGLPETYDLVAIVGGPREPRALSALLCSARRGLRPGGACVLLASRDAGPSGDSARARQARREPDDRPADPAAAR